jgi:hypothetical protein
MLRGRFRVIADTKTRERLILAGCGVQINVKPMVPRACKTGRVSVLSA